jgi:hypothetical protein
MYRKNLDGSFLYNSEGVTHHIVMLNPTEVCMKHSHLWHTMGDENYSEEAMIGLSFIT